MSDPLYHDSRSSFRASHLPDYFSFWRTEEIDPVDFAQRHPAGEWISCFARLISRMSSQRPDDPSSIIRDQVQELRSLLDPHQCMFLESPPSSGALWSIYNEYCTLLALQIAVANSPPDLSPNNSQLTSREALQFCHLVFSLTTPSDYRKATSSDFLVSTKRGLLNTLQEETVRGHALWTWRTGERSARARKALESINACMIDSTGTSLSRIVKGVNGLCGCHFIGQSKPTDHRSEVICANQPNWSAELSESMLIASTALAKNRSEFREMCVAEQERESLLTSGSLQPIENAPLLSFDEDPTLFDVVSPRHLARSSVKTVIDSIDHSMDRKKSRGNLGDVFESLYNLLLSGVYAGEYSTDLGEGLADAVLNSSGKAVLFEFKSVVNHPDWEYRHSDPKTMAEGLENYQGITKAVRQIQETISAIVSNDLKLSDSNDLTSLIPCIVIPGPAPQHQLCGQLLRGVPSRIQNTGRFKVTPYQLIDLSALIELGKWRNHDLAAFFEARAMSSPNRFKPLVAYLQDNYDLPCEQPSWVWDIQKDLMLKCGYSQEFLSRITSNAENTGQSMNT